MTDEELRESARKLCDNIERRFLQKDEQPNGIPRYVFFMRMMGIFIFSLICGAALSVADTWRNFFLTLLVLVTTYGAGILANYNERR